MVPILLNNTGEGLSLESFQERMIEICNEHRRDSRALAFALILYDFTTPQVSKILRDEDYWLALNEISGNYLTVFSINCKPQARRIVPSAQDLSTYHRMVGVNSPSNPSRGTNALVDRYFGGSWRVSYPAVMFFQVDENRVSDSLLVVLQEQRLESAFLELKNCIDAAVGALRRITDDNRGNFGEIFDSLETAIKSSRDMRIVKRILQAGIDIQNLISSTKTLF